MTRKLVILSLLLSGILASQATAQDEKTYISTAGEVIFSFADVNINGEEDGVILRFSPFFNSQTLFNYDPNQYFGLFGGLSIRNVGFIYEFPDSDIKKKFRTYNLGLPLGIKLGKLDRAFLYGGYEFELPFHYKEKTFIDGEKEDKFGVWFSERTPDLYESFFLGIQFPYGMNLKFKYYLTNFFNEDFERTENGQVTRPYEGFDANVFYISLNSNLFFNKKKMKFRKE